jgi:hypothetical protein
MMTDTAHTLRRGPRAGILRGRFDDPDSLPAPTESVATGRRVKQKGHLLAFL